MFGLVSAQAGSQKAALGSLLVFFTIGLLLMTRVKSVETGYSPEE
jgi:MFS transporter, UMF1 family